MELREEVARALMDLEDRTAGMELGRDNSLAAADAILSLPRIREALQVYEDHEKMMKTIGENTL